MSRQRRLQPHISRINFGRFFVSAFGGVRAAQEFHDTLGGTEGEPRQTALLILNQTARLLWLGDRVKRVAKGRPALQIMFFMFAAEAVAKLFTKYKGEGDSKRSVREFFVFICADEHRKRLIEALRVPLFPSVEASPTAIVDFLYRIRCDVVHRWQYFGMNLPREVIPELRAIVLEGAAYAARTSVDLDRRRQVMAAIEARRRIESPKRRARLGKGLPSTVNPRGPKRGER